MATRSARRSIGARAILAASMLAIVAASLPGFALTAPNLSSSSVDSGWAQITRKIDPSGGFAFDPNDATGQKADGAVEFITTRWDKPLIPSHTNPITSVTTVDSAITITHDVPSTDPITGDPIVLTGVPVVGSTVFDIVPRQTSSGYSYTTTEYAGRPFQVMTFLVGATPGGHLTSSSPYSIHYKATTLNTNGTPGATTELDGTFLLDRQVAKRPSLSSPDSTTICGRDGGGPFGDPVTDQGCQTLFGPNHDSVNGSLFLPGDSVVVSGTAVDALTYPFESADPEKWQETSGVHSVVIRLYGENPIVPPNKYFSIGKGTDLVRSYQIDAPCVDTAPEADAITRCPDTFNFSKDITGDLSAGNWYGIDVYSIDLAGFHGNVPSNKGANVTNLSSGETDSIAFFYAG